MVINLTRGQVAIVDDDDYERLSQHKWCAIWSSHCKSFYAARKQRVDGKKRTVIMHREVLGLSRGDGFQCDHKNHDTLDNRKDNLRVSSNSQNQLNKKLYANNTSGFKGVSWSDRGKGWLAKIDVDRKQIFLGYYDTAEKAASIYDFAAIALHGEFASTNGVYV